MMCALRSRYVRVFASRETFEETVRFYRDVLELEQVSPAGRTLKFKLPGWGDEGLEVSLTPGAATKRDTGIKLHVTDLKAATEHMRLEGFLTDYPDMENIESVQVRDPAGNVLTFVGLRNN